VYTNQVHTITSTRVISIDLSDHLGTYVSINLDPNFVSESKSSEPDEFIKIRKFNAVNMETFTELLKDENWDAVYAENSTERKFECFATKFNQLYDAAFKQSSVRRKNQRKNPKPWILPWLEEACERRQNIYHNYVTNPTPANKRKYVKIKKFVDKHIIKAKNKYYSDFFSKHNDDSKRQWQLINNLLNRKRKSIKIDKIRDSEGNIYTSQKAVAQKFNEYFANIASKLKQNNSNCNVNFGMFLRNSVENTIYLTPTSQTEVSNIIRQLKVKATSDTNIAAIKRANELPGFSDVIAELVNSSLASGVFPTTLKTAKVVPIHKGGSKLDIQNYRPISLLSAFSKIFEKIMHQRVSNFLDKNNALHENQYGFRSGRSCEHALLLAQNEIASALNKKQIAMLLLIDFSKAFDMVDHNILLHKLQHYGIRGIAHTWFKSYLEGRKQYVELNGKQSSTMNMEFGVPQGSILGPLLFIIYINDIPEVQRLTKFILYADDANIIICGNDLSEIESKFNTLSTTLEGWVSANGLALNLKKKNYMIFSSRKVTLPFLPTIANRQLERKETARFLGVIVDEKLSWRQHLAAIKAKMGRYVGVMFKLKGILPIMARKNIFHSFVQSHINYCALVWGLGPKSNIEPLFREQKKAMRALMPGHRLNYYKDGRAPCHTKPAFAEYNILTVPMVILKNILIHMHKWDKLPQSIPPSILELVCGEAPVPGATYEASMDWLNKYDSVLLRRLVSYKGPLFYCDIMPKLAEHRESITDSSNNSLFSSLPSFKYCVKKFLLNIQRAGDPNEWCGENMPLYYVPGIRKSNRSNDS